MENKTNKIVGLSIEIVKNSIRFITPDGMVYYKNFTNFLEVIKKASVTNANVYSFAPLDDSEKEKRAEFEAHNEEVLYPSVEADAVVGA